LSPFRPRSARGAAGAALLLAALALTSAAAPGLARAQQSAPAASAACAAARKRSAAPAGQDSAVAKAARKTAKKKAAAAPLTPKQRLENEIRSAARNVRAAMVIQDTATLARLWSDDYIFTSLTGETYSKQERLESVMSPAFVVDEAAEVLPSEQDIVRVYGNVAVMHSRLGPPGAARSGARGGRARLLTVWVREKGRWRTVASQATGVTGSTPVAGRR
jgi:ketosteroid isomerase-like protein